jgi:hypothetical protein
MMETVYEYYDFYCDFLVFQWEHMTPTKYFVVLISIGVIGVATMHKGPKRL